MVTMGIAPIKVLHNTTQTHKALVSDAALNSSDAHTNLKAQYYQAHRGGGGGGQGGNAQSNGDASPGGGGGYASSG